MVVKQIKVVTSGYQDSKAGVCGLNLPWNYAILQEEAIKVFLTMAQSVQEIIDRERVRRTYKFYLTKIDNSVLNRGFQTWRMNCLLLKRFVENAKLGAQKLNKIFDSHAIRGLHSGFRQLVYYSMWVKQQRMRFGMAQKFIVNKVRQHIQRRQGIAFRKWVTNTTKLRIIAVKRRRACTYLHMKMEEGSSTSSFRKV